jgi:hypothetical protein
MNEMNALFWYCLAILTSKFEPNALFVFSLVFSLNSFSDAAQHSTQRSAEWCGGTLST